MEPSFHLAHEETPFAAGMWHLGDSTAAAATAVPARGTSLAQLNWPCPLVTLAGSPCKWYQAPPPHRCTMLWLFALGMR